MTPEQEKDLIESMIAFENASPAQRAEVYRILGLNAQPAMTPTLEEVAALVQLLQRPYGNMTGSERTDTAAALTALQARAEAAEARVRELEAANMRAWEAGRDAAALRIVRHEMGTPMHSPPQLLTEAHDAIMRLTPPASL